MARQVQRVQITLAEVEAHVGVADYQKRSVKDGELTRAGI